MRICVKIYTLLWLINRRRSRQIRGGLSKDSRHPERSMKTPAIVLLISLGSLHAETAVSFVRDVMPILNKAGCTQGTCHGAAKGKNGFKLSLRGYDPEFDYRALIHDLAGRRFNRADPGRSLMLLKPTAQLPHADG